VIEQHAHRVQPFVFRHFVEALADLAVVVMFFELHFLRIAKELLAQLRDAFRVRGRKEQRLALLGALARDGGDVVEEAHVEHAVGLVEHERIERFEREVAALEMVHDAARRAHHDMRAVFEARRLRAHGRTAAQRQHLDVFLGAREAPDFLCDLVGQLARGAQDHGLHVLAARVQTREERERERGGLAAAGLGLGDQVVAREGDGQARRLDRRHVDVAEAGEVGERGGGER